MSGGSLDYIGTKLEYAAGKLKGHNPYYDALAKHIDALSEVLYEVELSISGDRRSGKDIQLIKQFLGVDNIVKSTVEDIKSIIDDKMADLTALKEKL